MKYIALTSVFLLTLAAEARADADKSYINLALTRSDEESQQGSAKSAQVVTVYQLSLGLSVGAGFVVGGKYTNYGVSSSSSFSGSANNGLSLPEQGTTISGYGPLVGYYHSSGFYIQGAYLYTTTKVIKVGGGRITDEGGDGYTLDLGKAFELGKSFAAAVQLSKIHTSYKKSEDSSGVAVPRQTPWYDDSVRPYLTLFYFF